MEHYAGLDVSLELTSVCLVDGQGHVVREAKVASEPEALIRFLREQDLEIARVGLEAGPLSQWLHAGLSAVGLETVLLETRHVKAALSRVYGGIHYRFDGDAGLTLGRRVARWGLALAQEGHGRFPRSVGRDR